MQNTDVYKRKYKKYKKKYGGSVKHAEHAEQMGSLRSRMGTLARKVGSNAHTLRRRAMAAASSGIERARATIEGNVIEFFQNYEINPDKNVSSFKEKAISTNSLPKNITFNQCDEVTDDYINELLRDGRGTHIQEISLYDCNEITVESITTISTQCPNLKSINVAGCLRIPKDPIFKLQQDEGHFPVYHQERITPNGKIYFVKEEFNNRYHNHTSFVDDMVNNTTDLDDTVGSVELSDYFIPSAGNKTRIVNVWHVDN